MRLLLDTHAIIWWLLDDPKLSLLAEEAIRHPDNSAYVSAVVAWEIATKVRAGRLPSMADHVATFVDDVTGAGFYYLAVEPHHGLGGGMIEGDHKDPFDRIIAARALSEGMTVVTRDREFAAFGCEVLW